MAKVFITLTGTKHYFGNEFLERGMRLRLEKEPDNEYDKEAIKVTCEGLGKVGYVANSSYTVIGESMSAGRLYDKIGETAYAKVVLVTSVGTICKICKKSLKKDEAYIQESTAEKIHYTSPAYGILDLSLNKRRWDKCRREVTRNSSCTDLLGLCWNKRMKSIILRCLKSWKNWLNMI